MSLVAYEASSDEGSECEGDSEESIVRNISTARDPVKTSNKAELSNGHISDDDDDYIPHRDEKEIHFTNNLSKLLPKPKGALNFTEMVENFSKPTFSTLPIPKSVHTLNSIEEEDDEFLHKKSFKETIDHPTECVSSKKMPVKITIPSLKNFQDVEKDLADKARNMTTLSYSKAVSSSGLLSLLPKAKSEQCFTKETIGLNTTNASSSIKSTRPSLIPDSVKHRRPATNTEDVESLKPSKKNIKKQSNETTTAENNRDTDESDADFPENGDFFSFNTDESLPEVSVTELNSLVAKKATEMIEASSNFFRANEAQKSKIDEGMLICKHELESSIKRCHEQELNSDDLQALVGSSKKRRRQQSNIKIIDINSSQVMPKKDEWMRTALASSTTYQPTGVLVDEEPASGTRRKHQITYLAHKAKANEAELQAMWSANRQNRQATQSKYGF